MQALVYGFYGKANLGDQLFEQAFKHLFPSIDFTFTDCFTEHNIQDADLIIFGGGSFLYAPINGFKHLFSFKKPICYIGVGIETDIHPMHQELMRTAYLIAHRSRKEQVKQLNTNGRIIAIPDIVYALGDIATISPPKPKSILVLPNAEILPNNNDAHWKFSSWNYFKSEFSQLLDELKKSDYIIHFAPLCTMPTKHDLGAATEIINQMTRGSFDDQLFNLSDDFAKLTAIISQYEMVISQRYHGAILAHICMRPCIALAHHDKLKDISDASLSLSYYGISKQKLYQALSSAKTKPIMPINSNSYEELKAHMHLLEGAKCPNSSASKMDVFR